MSLAPLRLAPASKSATHFAVSHWHYSRKMPAGGYVSYGVWEGQEFIGVVVFGKGAGRRIGEPFGLAQVEICELLRVALREHRHPVTKIVAVALRLLARDNPYLKAVVSFADPAQGHTGTIYRAGNWHFVGEGGVKFRYFTPDGRSMHDRGAKMLVKTAEDRRRIFKVVEADPKLKFVYWLDREREREWLGRKEARVEREGGGAES